MDSEFRHTESQARHCADAILTVLVKTLLEKRPADRALSSVFYDHREYGSRDRRLISETLFSVLRWWGWLRHLAPKDFLDCCQNALAATDNEQQTNLPAFAFESFYPMFAASWLLDGKNELPPAADYWREVAGIQRDSLHFPPKDDSVLRRKQLLKPFFAARGITQTLKDEDLIPAWCIPFLAETTPVLELIEWLQHRPPVWIRVQTPRIQELYAELSPIFHPEAHPTLPNAWRLATAQGGNLRATNAFRNGWFEIQDAASQVVAYVCNPKPGQQWWDACAGGGGKTLHLATLMTQKGSILATDIRAHKLQDLKLRARRAQFPNIRCKEWQGKEPPAFKGLFDGILVDTPCSCSGTWRRNPDARWTTAPEEIQAFHDLQTQLLANASKMLKPHGTLVYSTCSMLKHENADVVNHFLASHPNFSLAPFVCPITGRQTDGMNQLMPWDADCDAMFTAKLIRNS